MVVEVYYLGGHNERTNLYIVRRILSELGKPESLITHVADRHGHDQRYAIDPHKANVELGWEPVTTFEEGIKKTIKWYRREPAVVGRMHFRRIQELVREELRG